MAEDFLREHQFIVDVMSTCTHDTSMAVDYQFLKPRIVNIFPRMTLSRDEGRNKASCDIMISICDSAKRLSKDDFIKFVDAIGEDYPHVALNIRETYRKVSGETLPSSTVEEHVATMCAYDVSNQRSPTRSTQPPRIFPDDVYFMDTEPRGLALIINNVKFDIFSAREGSNVDVANLTRMFQKLKFKTIVKENMTAEEMKQNCKQLAKNHELRNVAALSVVILTHGTSNECYFGRDGRVIDDMPMNYITKTELAQIFNSRNCQRMIEKPKLFIIQACRGDEENPAHVESREQEGSSLDNDAPRSDRQEDAPDHHLQSDNPSRADTADMCFLHSSSMGYKAYRGPSEGSPFVQKFTQLIANSSPADEFLDIVRKVVLIGLYHSDIFMEIGKDRSTPHAFLLTKWVLSGKDRSTPSAFFMDKRMQRSFSDQRLSNEMMTLPDFSSQLVKKWFIIPPPY